MKRLIIAFVLSFICSALYSQQAEVFGLKLGDKATRQQIIKAVGNHGTFDQASDTMATGNVKVHVFKEVANGGQYYSKIGFTTTSEDIIICIAYGMNTADNKAPELNRYFDTLKQKLSQKYSIHKNPNAEPNTVEYVAVSETDNVIISLSEELENEKPVYVSVSYFDLRSASALIEPNRPKLQDTFFGMTFGQKITLSKIRAALGTDVRGGDENKDGDIITYTFYDVKFAGTDWDYAVFACDSQGIFFNFKVYNSLDDDKYDTDRKGEAEYIYSSYKAKLDRKYGEGSEEVENEDRKETNYYGANNLSISLSSKRGLAHGGTFRKFVMIDYMDFKILQKIQEAADSEL